LFVYKSFGLSLVRDIVLSLGSGDGLDKRLVAQQEVSPIWKLSTEKLLNTLILVSKHEFEIKTNKVIKIL